MADFQKKSRFKGLTVRCRFTFGHKPRRHQMEEYLEYHNATKWGWRNKAGGSTKTGLKLGLKYKLNNQRHWGGGKWWRKTGEVNKVKQREDLIGWGDTGNRTGANEAEKKKKQVCIGKKSNAVKQGSEGEARPTQRGGQRSTEEQEHTRKWTKTIPNCYALWHKPIRLPRFNVSSIMLTSMNKDRIWLNNYYKRLINHDMV